MPKLILKHVTLYNAVEPVDCSIEDRKIAQIGTIDASENDRIIDASGLTLLPGVIDAHVHFRVPGAEQKEDWVTGVSAALAGGATSVLDMPNNTPAITTKALLEEKIRDIGEAHPQIDFGCYIGATNDNLDEIIASQDIACGVKIAPYFTGKDGKALIDDPAALRKLFEANLNIPIVVHCEDEDIVAENRATFARPTAADHNAIRSESAAMRALTHILLSAKGTKSQIHITHISTKHELETIRSAKQEGMDITCDVTPHHLTFNESDVQSFGWLLKVNPPIRSKQDCDAVWQGVLDGTIDMIASDHAPHLRAEKAQRDYDSVPPGVPGVQTLLPVLLDRLSHQFSLDDIVRLTSTAPRKRFRRSPIAIAPGNTADLVLVDLQKETRVSAEMLKSKCGWSPWEGKSLHGKVVMTIRNGSIVSRS